MWHQHMVVSKETVLLKEHASLDQLEKRPKRNCHGKLHQLFVLCFTLNIAGIILNSYIDMERF